MAPARLTPPDSVLTRAASNRAVKILPPALLNHSYRTYRFGRALGELEGLDVDTELLFAAAMLHDTGLVTPPVGADFTLASSRLAREVAETRRPLDRRHRGHADRHHDAPQPSRHPGATVRWPTCSRPAPPSTSSGSVPGAYLRTRSPTRSASTRETGFKTEFVSAFRQEAARIPEGRARFLHRYGAFAAAIRFAPFDE